ncbi:MAG: hypothetical protein R2729_23960 [Bryobacteraceae bacterium]
MTWNRSNTLILASNKCAYCHGAGMLEGRRGRQTPCNCVYRSVFRACYARFLQCSSEARHLCRSRYASAPKAGRRLSWDRREEEYIADFCIVARRNLDGIESKIFRYHFLLGADWKLCCRRLNMDRGTFFHAVYRIQQRLGKVFRELTPYALYPVEDYFSNTSRTAKPKSEGANVIPIDSGRNTGEPLRTPLRPPIRKAA